MPDAPNLHPDALQPWAPGQPLTAAEGQALAALATAKAGAARRLRAWLHARTADGADRADAAATAAGLFAAGRQAHDRQQWQLAEGSFALAVRLHRLGDDATTPAALQAQRWLGTTVRVRGNLPKSRELLEAVRAALVRQVGADHPDTLEVELDLAETHMFLGRYEEARDGQARVHAARRLALGDDHPLTAIAAGDLGASLSALGDLSRGTELLRGGWQACRAGLGPEHESTLGAENNLAAALAAAGDLAGAQQLMEHVLDAGRRAGQGPRQLLAYEGNLAVMLMYQGHKAQAQAIQERVLRERVTIFGAAHPDTLSAQSNLATTLRGSDPVRARQLAEQVLAHCRHGLGAGHPLTFAAEGTLANALQGPGEADLLRELALQGLPHLAKVAATAQQVFERYAFYLRVLAAQAADAHARHVPGQAAPGWIAPLLATLPDASAAFRDALELRHEDERRAALPRYAEFHEAWVSLCEHWAPARLPQALAPLHGLQGWAAAQQRLQAAPAVLSDGPQQRLQRARQALQRLRLRQATLASMIDSSVRQLAEAQAGPAAADGAQPGAGCPEGAGPPGSPDGADAADDGADRADEGDSADTPEAAFASPLAALRHELRSHRRQRRALLDEEDALLRRYRLARDELARGDAGLAALLALPALDGTALAAHLAPAAALVITWARAGGGAAAVVVRPGTAARVELDALPTLAAQVRRYQAARRASWRGAVLRDGLAADTVAPAPALADEAGAPTAAELADAVRQAFWLPLAPALNGVRCVHLVSGPGQHGLPLECGADTALTVHRSFGLPAYLCLRDRPLRPAKGRAPGLALALDIVCDPAWQRQPIPFVETEAAVVRALLQAAPAGVSPPGARARVRRVGAAAFLAGRARAGRLQLCLHGGSAGAAGREHGYLVLDAGSRPPRVLDPPAAAALPLAAAEIVASACMGAVVGNDAAGSAMGVCSEWQLRGVAAVVACLMPVEDHFMPLLIGLYWLHRLDGVAPHAALQAAKADLRRGSWPAALLPPLRTAYRHTMRKVLLRARHAPGDGPARLAAQSVAGWLLPPWVRSSHFDDGRLDDERHRDFSVRWCETRAARERLIDRCLHHLIEERARPEDIAVRAHATAAIDNLCAFTGCYGNGDIAEAAAGVAR